ncbi:MAG: FkbM family methyltransferase [Gammaproteobacteria bacterium]|jgi:FkbM family methyltransferase|nr:FkbM family methyltransferase [Gammaproteobacteria bacterium]
MTVGYCDNLIYDVGMHTGQDTAYYLFKGYDVIAIEANPALVRKAESRFREAIADGQLQILHIGIAAEPGEADFFISTKKSVWSSFDKANATKDGSGFKICRLRCTPFHNILRQYGVPHYLKVDIEGNDHLCLDALEVECLPQYISVEMSHQGGGEAIRHLKELGYTGFKFARQNDLTVLEPDRLPAYLESRRQAAVHSLRGHIARRTNNLWLRVRRPRHAGWVFPKGASGPFGEDLPGRWTDAAEATRTWKALTDADLTLSGAALGDWFDIHATR